MGDRRELSKIENSDLCQIGQAIIEEIHNLHGEIQGHMKMTVEKAVRLGELLVNVKNMLPYGEFGAWIEENCHFSRQSAYNYMKVADKQKEVSCKTVLQLTDMYRMITHKDSENENADDADVIEIVEADEDAEKKELYAKIENLEGDLKQLERSNEYSQKTIAKLERQVNDYESLENETPEKLRAYAKIAAVGGEPELDAKETSQILLKIQKSRRFFKSEVLQIQGMYTPKIAKEALGDEVESLIICMEKWIESMRRQFDLEA